MARVLFFAPHSYIWEHAFPEALVAEALRKAGDDVVLVGCGRPLKAYCYAMSARGLTQEASEEERSKVCAACEGHKELLRSEMGLAGPDLSQLLTASDYGETERRVGAVTREDYLSFAVDGIQLGRVALYEFLLQHKKHELKFSDLEWRRYLIALKNVLLSHAACKRALDAEKPDAVVVYNSLVSVHAVWRANAQLRGIPHYFLHAGSNLSDRLGTLMLGRDFTWRFLKGLVQRWPELGDRPCSRPLLSKVTDHFLELLAGRSVFAYSAGKSRVHVDVRSRVGVGPNQKILVASMSSYDERFAVETVGAFPSDYQLLFPKQVDWIRELIRRVRERPEWFLLIRVHPREFPNKREGVKSEHASLLERLFAELPPNVKVDWPADRLSLYDLAGEADVFLNAWSSVGKEMSLLGIPVVVYSPDLLLYPADLNYVGTTLNEYFAQVDRALEDGWSFERARMTYRWMALEFARSVIRIDESYAGPPPRAHGFFKRALSKIKRLLTRSHSPARQVARRAERLRDQAVLHEVFARGAEMPLDIPEFDRDPAVPIEQETSDIKAEMRRLAAALWGAGSAEPKSKLRRSWEAALGVTE